MKTKADAVGMVAGRGFRVVDEAKIPHEYWILDLLRIRQCYKTGGDV